MSSSPWTLERSYQRPGRRAQDRKSTRLNSSHLGISYAVFCLKKKMLDQLEASYGGLKGLVRDEGGEVHHHVNIYVNSEAIESLQGLRTPLQDGDEVTIIPALAGGGRAPVVAAA